MKTGWYFVKTFYPWLGPAVNVVRLKRNIFGRLKWCTPYLVLEAYRRVEL